MQRNKFFKLFFLFLLLPAIILTMSGCGLKQGNMEAIREVSGSVTLRYWRVFDGDDSFREIIAGYRAMHPNVNIEYRKLRYEEYEQAMLEAWAEDRGPDIFSIHNTWIGKYANKIEPMPESFKLPFVLKRNSKSGAVEKADYSVVRGLTAFDIRNDFAEVVYQDVIKAGKVYALPLSVDTLALFYNRTMLDNAQIVKVPASWLEVKEAVKKLTLQDDKGNIVQAGIALGGWNNINRASDILSLLMMQNGTEMTEASGRSAIFNQPSPYAKDKDYRPGLEALRFYTDFAMPSKEVYTWNKEMPEASEAFANGRLAMMLGYAYQLPLIKTQAGRLNIGVAPVPHINIDGSDALGHQVNLASYWVETVSKKSEQSKYAWDFLMYATNAEQSAKYLKITGKPPALRSLTAAEKISPEEKVFYDQILTARSWYKGVNPSVMEEVFGQMIQSVVEGKNTVAEAINYAVERVNQTF